MSRHHLVAVDPAHEVVVGWDRPLRTFFAQVTNVIADEDSDARTVLWIGGGREEVPNPATAVHAVAPYAAVPADLVQTLRSDWAASVQQHR